MSDMRNWPASVWPASYKGFPFFVDSDEEEGGLNPVIHKFPGRDDPYIEDLGEEPRFYGGVVYVHGDNADAQAKAFTGVLASHGAGLLVLPQTGPVLVQALPFKRKNEKDKYGLVAFEVKFVREGAPTALVSLGALANGAYGAAVALASAVVSNFVARAAVSGAPDYVAAPVFDTMAQGAAAVDAQRVSLPVDPAMSATLRDDLSAIVAAADAAPADVSELATALVEATAALADALPPDTAFAAMTALADAFPPVAGTTQEAINADAAARLVRLAALTAYAEAILRRTFGARPDAVAAREAMLMRFDAELEAAGGADNAALAVAIQDMRGAVIDYLGRLITNLAPVVTVRTARSLPALVLAWRLYADPGRAGELVARNRVRHPSFMPTTFEALAR